MGLIAHCIELILKSEKNDDKKGNATKMRKEELEKLKNERDALEFIFDDEDYD